MEDTMEGQIELKKIDPALNVIARAIFETMFEALSSINRLDGDSIIAIMSTMLQNFITNAIYHNDYASIMMLRANLLNIVKNRINTIKTPDTETTQLCAKIEREIEKYKKCHKTS
jgi:hypothetical protein